MTQDISKYASRTVGEIVADNYAAADVFHHFGVDFCCHGSDNYLEAVGKANADPERVAAVATEINPKMMEHVSRSIVVGHDFSYCS